jgi:hypothetical protein
LEKQKTYRKEEDEDDGEQVLANIAHHISELAGQAKKNEEKHRNAEMDELQQQKLLIEQLEDANRQITFARDAIARDMKDVQLVLEQERLLSKELQDKNHTLESELLEARGNYKSDHAALATARADKERVEMELEHNKQRYEHMTRNYKNLQSLFKEEKKKRLEAEKHYSELQQQVQQMRLAIHQHKVKMEKSVKQAQTDADEIAEQHHNAKEDITTLLNYISEVEEEQESEKVSTKLVERVKEILTQYNPHDKLYERLSRRQSTGTSDQLQEPLLRNFNDTKHLAGPSANSSTYTWGSSLRPTRKIPAPTMRSQSALGQKERSTTPPRRVSMSKEAAADEIAKLLENATGTAQPRETKPTVNRRHSLATSHTSTEQNQSPRKSEDSSNSDLSAILNKLSVDDVAKLLKEVLGGETTTPTSSDSNSSNGEPLTRDKHFPPEDETEIKRRREIEVKESIRNRVEREREKYGISTPELTVKNQLL